MVKVSNFGFTITKLNQYLLTMTSKRQNFNLFSKTTMSKLSIAHTMIILFVLSHSNHFCEGTNTTRKVRVRQREFLRGGDRPAPTTTTTTPAPTITSTIKPLSTVKFVLSDNWTSPVVLNATGNHTATIIFLHGVGSTGNGWAYSLAHLRPPYLKVICPSAQERPTPYDGGVQSTWFNQGVDGDTHAENKSLRHSAEYIHKLMYEEIKSGIKSERILVGGFSQGGAMALHTAITFPQKLGGIISFSGWLPLAQTFFSTYHPQQKDVPILIGHGMKDDIIPLNVGEFCGHTLKLCSKNTEFKAYNDTKHEILIEGMDDLKNFIIKCLGTS